MLLTVGRVEARARQQGWGRGSGEGRAGPSCRKGGQFAYLQDSEVQGYWERGSQGEGSLGAFEAELLTGCG